MTAKKGTLLNVKSTQKRCHKSIGIGIGNTFQNQYWCCYQQYCIFCQTIVIVIDNSFYKYC